MPYKPESPIVIGSTGEQWEGGTINRHLRQLYALLAGSAEVIQISWGPLKTGKISLQNVNIYLIFFPIFRIHQNDVATIICSLWNFQIGIIKNTLGRFNFDSGGTFLAAKQRSYFQASDSQNVPNNFAPFNT